MPFLIAALWGALASVMGSLVGRVLLALGVSYVTFKGLDVSVNFAIEAMRDSFTGIGGEVGELLRFLWIDRALSMVTSAFAASLVIRTGAGAVTKMVLKK
jgi:hypothetical protein